MEQFAQRKVEPNSGLGQAISYMRKHWQQLTLFLRKAGAPLDNNVCEQALKKAILHRKNALFYKTTQGAHVGDMFMSLIHTCGLVGANPFDYLTALQKHSTALSQSPSSGCPGITARPWRESTPLSSTPRSDLQPLPRATAGGYLARCQPYLSCAPSTCRSSNTEHRAGLPAVGPAAAVHAHRKDTAVRTPNTAPASRLWGRRPLCTPTERTRYCRAGARLLVLTRVL